MDYNYFNSYFLIKKIKISDMFLRNRLHSLRNLARFSTVQTTRPGAVEARVPLQFTKRNLTEFGELPFGEIPEALKYDRPTGMR